MFSQDVVSPGDHLGIQAQWISDDLVKISLSELCPLLKLLEKQGFTEIFLQNPVTDVRHPVTLDAIDEYVGLTS
jgi:hypothetical protein